MAKINVRSPHYKKVSNASLSYAVLKLYVYSGTLTTDKPATPQYTITKKIVGSNDYVVFEISELVRDFIEHKFDGDYVDDDSEVLWAESDIELFDSSDVSLGNSDTNDIAYDGYGYFEDGANPTLEQSCLQTNKIVYKPDDNALRVAVDSDNTTNVTFFYEGAEVYSETVTTTNESTDKVQYISNVADNIDDFESRVLADGGTFESNECLSKFFCSHILYPIDKVYVNGKLGLTILKVINTQESKYTPLKITFINRFGVYQDLWFFKKSIKSMSVKSENFKANVFDEGTLSYGNSRQMNVFNVNANETLKLNSGYVNEDLSNTFNELLLSTDIWVTIENNVLPVNIKTKSLEFKTSLNDNLINQNIEFDFANNKINNIR